MTDAHPRQAGETRRPTWRELALGPVIIWLVLLVILGASAGSAFIPLGSFNPALNLALAAVMLGLLGTYLMELRSAPPVIHLVVGAGLFWVIFLFSLTFTDYLSRRPTAHSNPAHVVLLEPRPGSPTRV